MPNTLTTSETAREAGAPAAATAETKPSDSATAAAALPPQRMVAVLRRKRRRPKIDRRTLRVRLVLLAFVTGLLLLALGGDGLRRGIGSSLQQMVPALGRGVAVRVEVIVLVFAALVLVYLLPGVEERVLKALGVRRSSERRERASRRSSRR